MSTLAFSAGMAAPLVYLSFSFYDRYGFSKKLCNAFCAASCIAAALTALLSIVLKLSVEFAVLSCIALLACCFIVRAFFRNKKERTCSENAATARISLTVRIFIAALLLCIGFFRQKLFDALLKQGAYSFFYCAAWFLALIPTTVLNAADILRPMCRRQKAEEQLH